MSESLQREPFLETQDIQEIKKQFISLAQELIQRSEGFPFPGVNEETIKKLKAVDEKYPGYTTPIEELIDKMKPGVTVVPGEDPDSGNVFIVPLSSDNSRMDSLLPRHLDTNPDMDEKFRSLILMQKAMFKLEQRAD